MNGTGSLTFRAEGVGEETVLAKIIAFVERAQGTKAPVARLADRIAAYFAPAVLARGGGNVCRLVCARRAATRCARLW